MAAKKPMFVVNPARTSSSAWNTDRRDEQLVEIYTDSGETPGGTLVCSKIPRSKLFTSIPALQKYANPATDAVLLPGAEYGVDDEVLYQVIHAVLYKPAQEGGFYLEIMEEPGTYIQYHVVLVLLELEKEARMLQDRFWMLLRVCELRFEVVTWIWETFSRGLEIHRGPSCTAGSYAPRFSDFYVSVMAWQILNLKALGKLNPLIHEYVYGDGPTSQPRLRQMIEERERKYGLNEGYEMPSPGTEQSEEKVFADRRQLSSASVKDGSKLDNPTGLPKADRKKNIEAAQPVRSSMPTKPASSGITGSVPVGLGIKFGHGPKASNSVASTFGTVPTPSADPKSTTGNNLRRGNPIEPFGAAPEQQKAPNLLGSAFSTASSTTGWMFGGGNNTLGSAQPQRNMSNVPGSGFASNNQRPSSSTSGVFGTTQLQQNTSSQSAGSTFVGFGSNTQRPSASPSGVFGATPSQQNHTQLQQNTSSQSAGSTFGGFGSNTQRPSTSPSGVFGATPSQRNQSFQGTGNTFAAFGGNTAGPSTSPSFVFGAGQSQQNTSFPNPGNSFAGFGNTANRQPGSSVGGSRPSTPTNNAFQPSNFAFNTENNGGDNPFAFQAGSGTSTRKISTPRRRKMR